MVGFYTGMKNRQAEKASDRRKTYQLFQDYVNNARTNGTELTEAGMTDFWSNNSGNRFTRNAMPSQARLQSLVQGQNDHLGRQQAARDLEDIRNNAELDAIVSGWQNEFYGSNAYVEGDNSGAMDYLSQRVGDNALLSSAYDRVIGDGSTLGSGHKAYQQNQFLDNYSRVAPLISDGAYDAASIQGFLPNAPKHIISQISERAKADWDRKVELQDQTDMDRKLNQRQGAVAHLANLAKVNPNSVDIDATLNSLNITDPSEIEIIKANFLAKVSAEEQTAMESGNTAILAKQKELVAQSAESINAMRDSLKKDTDNYFASFNDNVTLRQAIAYIQETYQLSAQSAVRLSDYLADKDEEWSNQSGGELIKAIINDSDSGVKNLPTYAALTRQGARSARSSAGMEMYTVEGFRRTVTPEVQGLSERLIAKLDEAAELDSPSLHAKAMSQITLFAEDVVSQMNGRIKNHQKSFGVRSDKAEAYEAVQEVLDVITNLNEQAKTYTAPVVQSTLPISGKTTKDRIGQKIEQLDNQRNAIEKTVTSVGSKYPKSTLSKADQAEYDKITAVMESLQAQLDNL